MNGHLLKPTLLRRKVFGFREVGVYLSGVEMALRATTWELMY